MHVCHTHTQNTHTPTRARTHNHTHTQTHTQMNSFLLQNIRSCGSWWLSGKFGALHPEERKFESHSSRHVWTLGKPLTHSYLLRFGVLTPTQHQYCSRKRLSVVVDLKRRYRNIRNE